MTALKTTTRITKTPRLAATRVTPSSRISLDSELLLKFVQDNSNRSSSNKERYQNQFKTRQINPSKVPGGWGTRTEINDIKFLNRIADRVARTKLTASVCTGSSLLGKAGLLDGREATIHWRAIDFLRKASPEVKIRNDVRFTLVEPIFTSAGVSAGIDLALRIVSHFFGTEIGVATARQMEYPYPQNDQRMYI
jgi:transcriptional regulator GlxA family with amidase domain